MKILTNVKQLEQVEINNTYLKLNIIKVFFYNLYKNCIFQFLYLFVHVHIHMPICKFYFHVCVYLHNVNVQISISSHVVIFVSNKSCKVISLQDTSTVKNTGKLNYWLVAKYKKRSIKGMRQGSVRSFWTIVDCRVFFLKLSYV